MTDDAHGQRLSPFCDRPENCHDLPSMKENTGVEVEGMT